MPLLTPQTKIEREEFRCKLPVAVIADLRAYALAIQSDENYVVQKAVEKLTADKDFQKWKEENQEKWAAPAGTKSSAKRGPKVKVIPAA